MEDVAVYGYITPLKVKIVLAVALSDAVVRDVEVNMARPHLILHFVIPILTRISRSSKPSIWLITLLLRIHS